MANENKSKKWNVLGNFVEVNLKGTLISERNKGNLWTKSIG
jgi:hypothetical protein